MEVGYDHVSFKKKESVNIEKAEAVPAVEE